MTSSVMEQNLFHRFVLGLTNGALLALALTFILAGPMAGLRAGWRDEQSDAQRVHAPVPTSHSRCMRCPPFKSLTQTLALKPTQVKDVRCYLENIHIFALAHVLRRPIIDRKSTRLNSSHT